MNRATVLLLASALTACSAPDRSRATLKKAGFENIEITGWSPFSCGEDDTFSTGFVATNSNGQTVEGVVCCGMITKNCTVRF